MANIKRFKIKGLKNKDSFADASKIVLRQKLKVVFEEIELYEKDDSPKNLHDLRIAVRRFRFNLEIFYGCIKPKLFAGIYESVEELQDIIGELRDLDVLEEKIRNVEKEIGNKVSDNFYQKISNERTLLKDKVKKELAEFYFNDHLKKLLLK